MFFCLAFWGISLLIGSTVYVLVPVDTWYMFVSDEVLGRVSSHMHLLYAIGSSIFIKALGIIFIIAIVLVVFGLLYMSIYESFQNRKLTMYRVLDFPEGTEPPSWKVWLSYIIVCEKMAPNN